MRNICVSLGLITILSGCGSSVEHWTCEIGTYRKATFTIDMTIDYENRTWEENNTGIREFKINGNKVFYSFKDDYSGEERIIALDTETGEYTTRGEYDAEVIGNCNKIQPLYKTPKQKHILTLR